MAHIFYTILCKKWLVLSVSDFVWGIYITGQQVNGVFGDRQYKSLAWSKPSFTVHSLQGGFVPCQVKFNVFL